MPIARSTPNSRARSSCSASIAPRMPMMATPTASQYKTSVMMNVRSNMSREISRMRALLFMISDCLPRLTRRNDSMTLSLSAPSSR